MPKTNYLLDKTVKIVTSLEAPPPNPR